MPERWPSVAESVAHLGGNPDSIYKWITRKSMHAHQIGRHWKALAFAIYRWVKGCLAVPDAATTATLLSDAN